MLTVAHITDVVDGRSNSGTARVASELISQISSSTEILQILIHFEKNENMIYKLPNTQEILIPLIKFPIAKHFFSFVLYWIKFRIYNKSIRFDAVHWHSSRVYPLFFLVPAKKIFITLHDVNSRIIRNSNTIWTHIFYWNLRIFQFKVEAIFGDSRDACKKMVSVGKFKDNKVKCLYIASNFESISAIKPKKFEQEKGFFLCVSRWQPYKNVATLIEAYSQAVNILPEIPKLILVGKPVSRYDLPRQLVNTLGMSDRVTIFEDLTDQELAYLYDSASINIVPSLHEGFGLSVLEGLKRSCPSIDHKFTSTSEISGNAGIHIDMSSINELKLAMISIIEDPGSIGNLKDNCKSRSSKFTWVQSSQILSMFYHGIILDSE